MPRVYTAPPALVPYRFGANAAIAWDTPLDPHELGGIQWVSQGCSSVNVTGDLCVNPEQAALVVTEDFCQIGFADPFTVYSLHEGGLYGADQTLLNERFAAAEQYGLEMELQTLLDAATTPLVLGSAVFLAEGVAAAQAALAYVEQRIAEIAKTEAVIHMDRLTASLLSGSLSATSGALRTTLGNIVVAGAGYDSVGGTEPDALTIYATGPLRAIRSTVQANDAVITESNDHATLLQRNYAIGWDCGAVAASVTLT